MNETLYFDMIVSILICCFLTMFGIIAEKWLVKNGFVRDKTFAVIVTAVSSVLMKQIWFHKISWWFFVPLTVIAVILGVNRGDLWTTMSKGKWWWK